MKFVFKWNIVVKLIIIAVFLMSMNVMSAAKKQKDYPVKPVQFTDVRVNDIFWAPRMETNRTVTIPFAFKKCEETGRINNFSKAAGMMEGKFEGYRYNDSDVYKVMEGASYSLSLHPDSRLEKYMDDLIAKVAAAQEDDGYLYTSRTIDPDHPAAGAGDKRWSNLGVSHELYCAGHMYEAAVAYYLATGKRTLLDVAVKNADLVDRVFGPDKKHGAPGHQEIEIGLAKLYRVTGNEKYLRLAKFFLDERGPSLKLKIYPKSSNFAVYSELEYLQSHKPVIEQREAVGHAVRAGYMYSGMADVAALTGDKDYISAIDRIWENVITKKLYLTGGIGARHEGEAFGDNYELPNRTAYNETCAAIANAMWNHRLFLLHRDAKYIDVLERIVYNGLISGVSLSGDRFFYPNPLESDGKYKFNQGELTRKPWFDCACCPGNITRFLPSFPGYIYAQKGDIIYINLFVQSSSTIEIDGNRINIGQETRYPWDGAVKIAVDPERSGKFALHIRIPGWSQGNPVPGDLYSYKEKSKGEVVLKVNGKKCRIDTNKGFARIRRRWEKGDKVEILFPIQVRRVLCNEKVEENLGKVALERGPVVYCLEGADNNGHVLELSLPDDSVLEAEYCGDKLGGIMLIKGECAALDSVKEGKQLRKKFTAIPYYVWGHRGAGEMAVWIPRKK